MFCRTSRHWGCSHARWICTPPLTSSQRLESILLKTKCVPWKLMEEAEDQASQDQGFSLEVKAAWSLSEEERAPFFILGLNPPPDP